jgi:hypothetical protein
LIKTRGREVHIPIECCNISLRPQKVHRQLNPNVLRRICAVASNDPRAYFDKVNRNAQLAILDNPNAMQEFGVDIPVQWVSETEAKLQPMQIDARVLPHPECAYKVSLFWS